MKYSICIIMKILYFMILWSFKPRSEMVGMIFALTTHADLKLKGFCRGKKTGADHALTWIVLKPYVNLSKLGSPAAPIINNKIQKKDVKN